MLMNAPSKQVMQNEGLCFIVSCSQFFHEIDLLDLSKFVWKLFILKTAFHWIFFS